MHNLEPIFTSVPWMPQNVVFSLFGNLVTLHLGGKYLIKYKQVGLYSDYRKLQLDGGITILKL